MFLAMCWRYLSIPRHEGKTFADIVFENGFLYFLVRDILVIFFIIFPNIPVTGSFWYAIFAKLFLISL